MLLSSLASIAVGFAVGMLSGLLGIGGGTVLVVVFSLAFGMRALQATATSLFTIIPTSFSGALTHLRGKTCIWGVGLCAGVGGALTSPIGVWLASLSPEWLVMIAVAVVVGYSSISMFRKAFQLREKQKKAAVESQSAAVCDVDDIKDATDFKFDRVIGIKSAAIGLITGVMSGYVGLGGGFLMVPLFVSLLGIPMKLTSGTSLFAIMIIAIPGTIAQALYGNVDWIVGISVAIGSLPGAYVGAKLVKRVPELALRFAFGAFLLVTAALITITQFV